MFQHAKAGMVAGVFTTVFMAPGERIKCLLQVLLLHTNSDPYTVDLEIFVQRNFRMINFCVKFFL